MNHVERLTALATILVLGLGATACGGSSSGDNTSKTPDAAPTTASAATAAADPSGGSDSGGLSATCPQIAPVVKNVLGVSGHTKTDSSGHGTLQCEFGTGGATTIVRIQVADYIGQSTLADNKKNLTGTADVSGVGDAAFSSKSAAGYALGAVQGHELLFIMGGNHPLPKLTEAANDLLASVG